MMDLYESVRWDVEYVHIKEFHTFSHKLDQLSVLKASKEPKKQKNERMERR